MKHFQFIPPMLLMVVWAVVAFGENGSETPLEPELPKSIFIASETDSLITFGIPKLYGHSLEWRHFSNRHARRSNKFAENDSFFVDINKGIGYFQTGSRSNSKLKKTIDWLAGHTGYVPTWEELQIRGRRSKNFGHISYRLLAKTQIGSMGLAYTFLDAKSDSTGAFKLRFIDRSKGSKKGPCILLTIRWDKQIGSLINFSKGDVVDPKVYSGENRQKHPQTAKLVLSNGKCGEARFNKATAHCMMEMSSSLRIFNDVGEYVWEAQGLIPGYRGVWASDLDKDGIDELLVLNVEHGTIHVSVFK